MNTCGIVALSCANELNSVQEFLFRRSPAALSNALVKLFGNNKYEMFELQEIDHKFYAVKLSFSYEQISSFRDTVLVSLFNQVAYWFEMHGINNIILPKELYTNPQVVKCFENFNYGKDNKKNLIMALTMDILKNISKTKGIDLSMGEFIVVDSQFSQKAVQMVEMLSSSAKCIMVITQNVKNAQQFAEKQFDENGLIIHVSGNMHTVANLTGIYFVMDGIEDVISKCRIGKNKIIFNFTSQNCRKYHESQLIIEGIYINLPESFKKVSEYLERSNIENFIESIIMRSAIDHETQYQPDIYTNIKNSFYQMGCRITALQYPNSGIRSQNSKNFIDNRQTVVYNK